VFLGLFAVFVVYVVARLFYNVPFVGSLTVFFAGTLLFLLTYLGIGLFVSTMVRNQQAAVQMAMAVGMLPAMLLSGFIFSLENMHAAFRFVATVLPAKWYMELARDQFLKGSTFFELWKHFLALSASLFVVIHVCVWKFKRTLEK
jgi:ABC-2 type transport system permease protein